MLLRFLSPIIEEGDDVVEKLSGTLKTALKGSSRKEKKTIKLHFASGNRVAIKSDKGSSLFLSVMPRERWEGRRRGGRRRNKKEEEEKEKGEEKEGRMKERKVEEERRRRTTKKNFSLPVSLLQCHGWSIWSCRQE